MVSLFDVSDLTSPILIDQYNLPKYSTSVANFDHHAFGWFATHRLAREYRPAGTSKIDSTMTMTGIPKRSARFARTRLSILHIGMDDASGAEGIMLHGEIDHTAAVLRSVYVNDNVYSVGLDAIRTVSVNDPGTVIDEIVFPDDSESPTPISERSRFDVARWKC